MKSKRLAVAGGLLLVMGTLAVTLHGQGAVSEARPRFGESAAGRDANRLTKTPKYTTVCAPPLPNARSRHVGTGGPGLLSLFGVPRMGGGACPHGFASAPAIGPLCYRSCRQDRECPDGASCRPTPGVHLKLCAVD